MAGGTGLYACPGKETLFCLWHWTQASGETCACPVVSREYAIRFVRDLCEERDAAIGPGHANLPEYLPEVYQGMKDLEGEQEERETNDTAQSSCTIPARYNQQRMPLWKVPHA